VDRLPLVVVIPLDLDDHRGLEFKDCPWTVPLLDQFVKFLALFRLGPEQPDLLPPMERVASRPLVIVPFLGTGG